MCESDKNQHDGKHVNLEKSADILDTRFKHYYQMAMDHHTKAATTSNILLVVVGAVIGLVTFDKKVSGIFDFLGGFTVSVLGLFGAVWAWKQHERYHYWEHIACEYEKELIRIVPMLKVREAYSKRAKEDTAKEFGSIFVKRILDRYLWVSLHCIVAIIGFGLMLVSVLCLAK